MNSRKRKTLIVFARLVTDIGETLLVKMMKNEKKVALVAVVQTYVDDIRGDVDGLHSYPSSLDPVWVQTRLQRGHAREDGSGSGIGSSREHEESWRATRVVERAAMVDMVRRAV